jgi:SsrA-binding protein
MKRVNKKAYYDYFVLENFTAGIMLQSSEVKSISMGDFNFESSFVTFKGNELFITNMRISPYKDASYNNHVEVRDRKLLLNKKELTKISKEIEQKGITIIPLEVFELNKKFKVKIGICRGRKNYDKRELIKKRDLERESGRKF